MSGYTENFYRYDINLKISLLYNPHTTGAGVDRSKIPLCFNLVNPSLFPSLLVIVRGGAGVWEKWSKVSLREEHV